MVYHTMRTSFNMLQFSNLVSTVYCFYQPSVLHKHVLMYVMTKYRGNVLSYIAPDMRNIHKNSFLISARKHILWGRSRFASHENSQHTFSWRNKKLGYQYNMVEQMSYLGLLLKYRSMWLIQWTLVTTTAFVPKDVSIKTNLLMYRILNEQIDM